MGFCKLESSWKSQGASLSLGHTSLCGATLRSVSPWALSVPTGLKEVVFQDFELQWSVLHTRDSLARLICFVRKAYVSQV